MNRMQLKNPRVDRYEKDFKKAYDFSNKKKQEDDESVVLDSFIDTKFPRINLDNIRDSVSRIIKELGFRDINNPFISFLLNYAKKNSKELLGLTNETLIILYNLYNDGIIDKLDLLGKQNSNEILFNPSLYKLPEEDIKFAIQTYIWFEAEPNLESYLNNDVVLKSDYNITKEDLKNSRVKELLRDKIIYSAGKVNTKERIELSLKKLQSLTRREKPGIINKKNSNFNLVDYLEASERELSKEEVAELLSFLNSKYTAR